MPNRIIKESICVSEQIDALSPVEEIAFYRLLVNCDDYGCFDAREKVVKSRLFPLRDISTDEVRQILNRLADVGLLTLYEVDGKPYLMVCKWADHQRVRVSVHKYPTPPQVAANCGELPRTAAKRGGSQKDAADCGLNPNPNPNPNPLIDDADAQEIQSEQNRVLDAAEDAGFPKSNSVRAGLIRLYADYGIEKVLKGLESCVKHSAPNLAYLEACLKDKPRKQKDQGFEQRDYSQVPSEQMEDLAAEMAAFKKGAV